VLECKGCRSAAFAQNIWLLRSFADKTSQVSGKRSSRFPVFIFCESDVKLLKAGYQKLRQEFRQKADFDLLEKYVIIASASPTDSDGRKWSRPRPSPRNHLEDGTGHDPTSPSKPFIRIVRNEDEVHVINHQVDGYDPATQTVYEFLGCLWRGCPPCFPRKRDRYPICHADCTLQEVYDATLRKHNVFEQRGYHLQVKWECDWTRRSKPMQTSNSSSTGLKSLTHCNPETPSSVDAPTPSNFIR